MSFWVVPASRSRRAPLFVGDGDIERHQPGRGGVDRHRGVHRGERDVVKQRAHVAEMGDRHADFADLAAGGRVVGVVAGLGRQIEGDREAGLALGEIGAIEAVRFERRRMAGVGAENPRLVARRRRRRCALRLHCAPPSSRPARFCAEHNYRKSRLGPAGSKVDAGRARAGRVAPLSARTRAFA
jgi:hypothetical protein